MYGGGPLPGNPTTSTNANVPPVFLPVTLNVTNSLFAIQTDLPSPGGTYAVLTMDVLLPHSFADHTSSRRLLGRMLATSLRKRFRNCFRHPAQVVGTGCACLTESGSPRSLSSPLRSTAFTATMIEESDISSA